jgi:hypothetical protein
VEVLVVPHLKISHAILKLVKKHLRKAVINQSGFLIRLDLK